MAFYKKQKLGKMVSAGSDGKSPFTTDDVAARLSKISTVSRGDTYAVLANLGDVLADMLSTGQSVRLMGIGTFYLTCQSVGQGWICLKRYHLGKLQPLRWGLFLNTSVVIKGRLPNRP